MRINSLTDIGSKRKDNQDNYWSAVLRVNETEEAGVICLCDGMGGLHNGGLASKMVVKAVRSYMLSDFTFDGLESVISSVNKEILDMSKGDKSLLMGTTCTVLLCYKGTYNIYHIGDSRAYVIRNGVASLLTTDHSAIQMYGIDKKTNPDLWNKYKNKLTRCIGVKEDIHLDYYNGLYQEGDVFFLCSDGCWHYFSDSPLVVDSAKDLNTLFQNCIANGETDNITAGVLFI